MMSAIVPKQTCRKTQSMSLLGVKRTWLFALHMSACEADIPGCTAHVRFQG